MKVFVFVYIYTYIWEKSSVNETASLTFTWFEIKVSPIHLVGIIFPSIDLMQNSNHRIRISR